MLWRSRSTPDFLADCLSRDHNGSLRVVAKTAKEWGVPPRQVYLGEPVQWNDRDSRLAMALTVLEQETCKECGTVAWLGHSANSSIVFKHDKQYCWGCAKLEEAREEDAKNKVKGHGAKPYVTAASFDASIPLPTRRDEFERREARAERERARRT